MHTSDERARAERFVRPDAARRWLTARAALRIALGERLGLAPEAVAFTQGEHGKPEIAGAALRFNLSHSGDLAVIAFARREVGVDVERAGRSARAVHRALTPGERAAGGDPLRVWCRKEALAKAIGTGLQWAPESFDTTAPGPYELHDLDVPAGYVAALAVAR